VLRHPLLASPARLIVSAGRLAQASRRAGWPLVLAALPPRRLRHQ
jgi:hypothetical protein